MLFICAEDFYRRAASVERPSREEERKLAESASNGNPLARRKLIEGYFYFVAARMKRAPENLQSLDLVYHCLSALERAVDEFDFSQDNEPFSHRLGLVLEKEIAARIARK